jgi:hypothetical protein
MVGLILSFAPTGSIQASSMPGLTKTVSKMGKQSGIERMVEYTGKYSGSHPMIARFLTGFDDDRANENGASKVQHFQILSGHF